VKKTFAMNMVCAALLCRLELATGQSPLSQNPLAAPVILPLLATAIAPVIQNVPRIINPVVARQILRDCGGFLGCSAFLDAVVEEF